MERLDSKISDVSDFPGSGIAFEGCTPLIRNADVLRAHEGTLEADIRLLATTGSTAIGGYGLLKSLDAIVAVYAFAVKPDFLEKPDFPACYSAHALLHY